MLIVLASPRRCLENKPALLLRITHIFNTIIVCRIGYQSCWYGDVEITMNTTAITTTKFEQSTNCRQLAKGIDFDVFKYGFNYGRFAINRLSVTEDYSTTCKDYLHVQYGLNQYGY